MAQSWIKLHTDLLHDPKILKLDPVGRLAWIGLLLLARHGRPTGTWKACSAETAAADLCEVLQIGNHPNGDEEVGCVRAALDSLTTNRSIRVTRDGLVVVTHWKNRQGETRPSSDPSEVRERVRLHRSRNANVTRCNAMKRGVTPDKKRGEEIRRDQKDTPQPPKGGVLAPFDSFWTAYPKKRAKGDALKAWKALKPDATLTARILAAVRSQSASADWRKAQGRYIPYPATWLRAQRWEDILDAPIDDAALPSVFEGRDDGTS